MTGYTYEEKCAHLLEYRGFTDITITPGSGDQGIDVIAYKENRKYGIQCKYYEGTVGNKAVQEAYAGAAFYSCDVALVMTNSTFTKSAVTLASKLGVELQGGIDAIALFEEMSIVDANLTPEEKEAAEIKRLEKRLEEKYQHLQKRFPENSDKDAEIADYCQRNKTHVNQLEDSFEKRCDSIYARMQRGTYRSMRDPNLTPFKEQLKHQIKHTGELLKAKLEEADKYATDCLKYGVSEKSVKELISLMTYIYYESDLQVSINYETIATFKWAAKHTRIYEKWREVESQLPSSIRARDKAEEAKIIRIANENLKEAKNKITQIKKKIKELEQTLLTRDADLDALRQELSACHEAINSSQQELTAAEDAVRSELAPIENDFSAAVRDYEQLLTQKYAMEAKLDSMSFWAFKGKRQLKEQLDDLSGKIADIDVRKTALQQQKDAIQIKHEPITAEIQKKIGALAESQEQLSKSISAMEKAIKSQSTEKAIQKKSAELDELESLLPELESKKKNAHKRFLQIALQA